MDAFGVAILSNKAAFRMNMPWNWGVFVNTGLKSVSIRFFTKKLVVSDGITHLPQVEQK